MSYVLNTPEDQRAMLDRIGAKSVEELFANVPAGLRLKRRLTTLKGLGGPCRAY